MEVSAIVLFQNCPYLTVNVEDFNDSTIYTYSTVLGFYSNETWRLQENFKLEINDNQYFTLMYFEINSCRFIEVHE